MLFSVVFTVDGPRSELPRIRRSLRERMGVAYSESEYRYLAKEEPRPEESYWYRAVSMGGSAILTRHEFAALWDDLGTPYATDCNTMGTLGGPLGWGFVPDIDFSGDSQEYILSMRVTPIPRRGNAAKDEEHADRLFERLKRAFVARYGGYGPSRDPKAVTHGKAYAKAVQRERKELKSLIG